ncbi:MAG: helix-turn-helix domain-containing protein [Betaproteobacteria bacterium]|nr:helix-turn-helix domain-containing protein [Betaproteobacteria bacterium]
MPSHPNRSRRKESPARNPNPDEIRAAREAAGLTQATAAALIYRTLRNWQQWEGGERRLDPALWELFLLKAALNNVRT